MLRYLRIIVVGRTNRIRPPTRSSVIDARDQSVVAEVRVGLGQDISLSIAEQVRFRLQHALRRCHGNKYHQSDVVATVPAGKGRASACCESPDGRYGYVANFASDDLTVWRTKDYGVVTRIPVGIYPHFFAISPNGQWIVVFQYG